MTSPASERRSRKSSGAVPSDQAAREAATRDLGASVCVEAAAGTGKTSLMVERVAHIIREGRAEIQQIVAITFTETAAAELRARIRSRLEDARNESKEDTHRERFRRAVDGLDAAHIETIHAFAQSLLRERPVEALVDPRFEVLDELGMRVDFDEAWDEWFSAAVEQDTAAVELALLLDFEFKEIKRLAFQLNQNRDLLPLAGWSLQEPDLEAYRASLSAASRELEELQADCFSAGDKGLLQIDQIVDYTARLAAADPTQAVRIIATDIDISGGHGNKTNWQPGSCDRQKAITSRLQEEQTAIREHYRSLALARLLSWLSEFPSWYEKRRRDAGTLDFDDLLVLTRRLLRDEPQVRRYFQDRYRYILVDEFQDTDPLQVEIVFYLSEISASPSEDWRTVDLVPGKLFVVGDPKQSIYRFRRADIAIYEEARRIIARTRPPVRIAQNFRCSRPVIEWTNKVFTEQMAGQPGVQADYIPLHGWPEREFDLVGPGFARLVPSEQPADNATGVRVQEAAHLAALVRSIVGQWDIEDPDVGDPSGPAYIRKARLSDIAVLMPTRTGLEHYEDALQEAGITYSHEGGSFFYLRQEVRDVIAFLLAIDNPGDMLSIAATLRHVYGLSDDELLRFRAAGGQFDYREPLPADSPATLLCCFEALGELHSMRNDVPLVALVEEVIDRSRLIELHLLRPQGRQSVANLAKLKQLARQFQGQPAATLHKFARWLRQSRDAEAREGDAFVAGPVGDELKLLTIHAAKGLEFPIVILANLGTNLNFSNQEFVDRATQQIHIRRGGRNKTEFKTPGFDAFMEHERDRDHAERLRQMYVAMTRARDHLVVMDFRGDKQANCWLGLLGSSLAAAPRLEEPAEQLLLTAAPEPPPRPPGLEGLLEGRDAWAQGRRELLARPRFVHVATATEERSSLAPAGLDAGAAPWPRSLPSEAARFGSAYHSCLEHLPGLAASDGTIRELTRHVAREHRLADWQSLAELVLSTLRSDVMRAAAVAPFCWREVPFSMPHHGTLVEGSIDMIFGSSGGLAVVDFKSDNVTAAEVEESANSYRSQAALYTFACERVTGRSVKEFIFFFARPDAQVVIPGSGLAEEALRVLESDNAA